MNGICGILAHLESIQSHLIQTLRLYLDISYGYFMRPKVLQLQKNFQQSQLKELIMPWNTTCYLKIG